jgi:protein-disulfide isomerase
MGKRQTIREQRRKQQVRQRWLWGGVLVVIAAVLVTLVLMAVLPSLDRIDPSELTQAPEKPFPQADFNHLGKPDAPVTVVEYADYLCSHCQEYTTKDEKAFIERYVASGLVQYEYLSVAFQAPNETKPIEATYCAGDQDAFWPYRDLVYANIAGNPNALGDRYLTAYAEAINLDMSAFNSCLRSGKYRSLNQENIQKASEAEIPGTPAFIVNGAKANRLDLHTVVDSELAKVGVTPP